MIDVAARWTARAVSLLLLGPLAARASGSVRGADGSGAYTLLTGESLGSGILGLGGVALCVWAAAGLGSRAADRHEGVLNAGLVLGWVAWTSGRLGEVYRLSPDAGVLMRLAAEGVAFALVVVASWWLADRLARRPAEEEGLSLSAGSVRAALAGSAGVAGAVAALAAALAVAWLFARNDLPGQSLGAAFLAGVGGGVAGTGVVQAMTKDDRSPPAEAWRLFVPSAVGVLAGAIAGPLVGLVAPGTGGLEAAVARATLPGWVVVTPAAWATGALVGVPIGISLLRSATKGEADGAAASAAG
jgi:hypothetical protein